MTKWDDTRYCLVWVFKLFNISIKLYHPSFFWDLRIKTQILQRVSLFIQDSSKKQHFAFFFLNIIILKCSPFFKRSKDKKKPKSFRQAKWQFLSTNLKLHVLCYWLLWTVLSTFFYAHLPSKHLISRHKIAFLIYSSTVHSPNMEIYNWVPPTKFTGAKMTALKKRETFYIG